MGRDAVSSTHSGSLKGCPGCVELSEARHAINALGVRVDDLEETVTTLDAVRIEHGQAIAVLMAAQSERRSDFVAMTEALERYRHEVASALSVGLMQRAGQDPREKTPSKVPELKAGPVSLKGPVWMVLVAVVVISLTLGAFGAGAYVAAEVWRPAKAASK